MIRHTTATATHDDNEITVQLGVVTKTFGKDEVTYPSDAVERTVRWFYGLAAEEIVEATHQFTHAPNQWSYAVKFSQPRPTL